MTNTKTTQAAYKVALSAMMSALALIFSYVEAIIPFSFGIPGIKLGIANLVILASLYVLGGRHTLVINVLRILIAGLLFNGFFGAMYSLAGGILSFFVMLLLKKTGLFSPIGVSMAGGVAHNLGQLLVAAAIVENMKLFFYFPVLLFSGMASGILIGILTHLILRKLPEGVKGE